MNPMELVRFALGAITAHPMRSALTSLGVVIGVAAVIMMTSIGLGAQQNVEKALSSLGTNMLVVRSGAPRGAGGGFVRGAGGGGTTLTAKDAGHPGAGRRLGRLAGRQRQRPAGV